MAHKTMVGGTACEITGGKTLIDGTAYSIKSGKTLVGGTAYEVGFGPAVVPVTINYSGNHSSGHFYFILDGVKYENYNGTIEIPAGTEMTFYINGTQFSNIIIGSGVVAFYACSGTYNYSVPETESVDITMQQHIASGGPDGETSYCIIRINEN